SYRILIGDDDADTVETTALLLQMNGHETRTASNGPDVLRQTENFDPHVILLDLAMPKMDGYEVTRAIREGHRVQQPVIVAVTGYENKPTQQRCAEAGFDLHLAKPVDFTLFEHCGLLLEKSTRLHEKTEELILQ